MRRDKLRANDCQCVEDGGKGPRTACSRSGILHVHPDDGTDTFGSLPGSPGTRKETCVASRPVQGKIRATTMPPGHIGSRSGGYTWMGELMNQPQADGTVEVTLTVRQVGNGGAAATTSYSRTSLTVHADTHYANGLTLQIIKYVTAQVLHALNIDPDDYEER